MNCLRRLMVEFKIVKVPELNGADLSTELVPELIIKYSKEQLEKEYIFLATCFPHPSFIFRTKEGI